MKQYIDKAAVMAEIEKYKDSFCDKNGYLENSETNGLAYDTLCELEDSIDTLGVKEVDLEKEFDKCCENYTFDDEWDVYIARRFFKLGYQKAQK
jgi:hypothetical protein